jgi:hypothetical protein
VGPLIPGGAKPRYAARGGMKTLVGVSIQGTGQKVGSNTTNLSHVVLRHKSSHSIIAAVTRE